MDESTVVEVSTEGEGNTRQVSIELDQGAWTECCGNDAQAHVNAWGDMLAQMTRAIAVGMEAQGLTRAEVSEFMLVQRVNETLSSVEAPPITRIVEFPMGDIGVN